MRKRGGKGEREDGGKEGVLIYSELLLWGETMEIIGAVLRTSMALTYLLLCIVDEDNRDRDIEVILTMCPSSIQ